MRFEQYEKKIKEAENGLEVITLITKASVDTDLQYDEFSLLKRMATNEIKRRTK